MILQLKIVHGNNGDCNLNSQTKNTFDNGNLPSFTDCTNEGDRENSSSGTIVTVSPSMINIMENNNDKTVVVLKMVQPQNSYVNVENYLSKIKTNIYCPHCNKLQSKYSKVYHC